MRIASANHEHLASLLADSGVDLNSQKAVCEFLANLPAFMPTHGMNARIWSRAKVLRAQQAKAPKSNAQFIAEMNACAERLISAASHGPAAQAAPDAFPGDPEDP